MTTQELRKLMAEAFGTFSLVFAGTGAIVINDVSGGAVSHVGIALTFGLIVAAMIYAVGDVSGCHLNPAVTLGFLAIRRIEGRLVIPYITSQIAGALLGSLVLRLMFPTHRTLGATCPADGALQSFVLEFILATILMFVILSVSNSRQYSTMAGAVVGVVIALEAMFAGPISGASMNPARSLAPAIIAGSFQSLWVYLTAPVIGALAGAGLCTVIHGPTCCLSTNEVNVEL